MNKLVLLAFLCTLAVATGLRYSLILVQDHEGLQGRKLLAQGVKCNEEHPNAGLSHDYAQKITHFLHRMDLQTLRQFVPDLKAGNRIPVVRPNEQQVEVVHASVPAVNYSAGSPCPFRTRAYEAANYFLYQSDKMNGSMTLPSNAPLDIHVYISILHHLHMLETWALALDHKMMDRITVDDETCGCLTQDLEANGILPVMRQYAQDINDNYKNVADRPWKEWQALNHGNECAHDHFQVFYFLKCAVKFLN